MKKSLIGLSMVSFFASSMLLAGGNAIDAATKTNGSSGCCAGLVSSQGNLTGLGGMVNINKTSITQIVSGGGATAPAPAPVTAPTPPPPPAFPVAAVCGNENFDDVVKATYGTIDFAKTYTDVMGTPCNLGTKTTWVKIIGKDVLGNIYDLGFVNTGASGGKATYYTSCTDIQGFSLPGTSSQYNITYNTVNSIPYGQFSWGNASIPGCYADYYCNNSGCTGTLVAKAPGYGYAGAFSSGSGGRAPNGTQPAEHNCLANPEMCWYK
jgi:hypothetical protein